MVYKWVTYNVKYMSTHCFANTTVVLLSFMVAILTLLLLSGQHFSVSVVSFGIAVDVQDVCGTQRPLKHFAAAVAQWRLLASTGLLSAQRNHLVLGGLRSRDVHSHHAVLLFFQRTSSVRRFLGIGFGLRFRLGFGPFLFLHLLDFHCV